MARDADALKIRKWAGEADDNVLDPEDASLDPALTRSVGWPESFSEQAGDSPRRQVVNQLFRELTGMAVEINQKGLLGWDAGISYVDDAVVEHGGNLWLSNQDDNLGNEPVSGSSYWDRVSGIQTEPGAVTGLTAAGGDRQVDLSWSPTLDGGAHITYQVQWRTAGGSFSSANQVETPHHDSTVTGLLNNTEYFFRVRGTNANGSGDWSAEVSATTAPGVPDTPAAPVLVPEVDAIRVHWTAPATHGSPIVGYGLQHSLSATFAHSSTLVAAGNVTSINITGLDHDSTYYFRVRAESNVGNSHWSRVTSASPLGSVPDPPVLSAVPGNEGTATLSWNVPPNGGFTIFLYHWQVRLAGADWVAETNDEIGTSVQLTGLEEGRNYVARVRAINDLGTSDWSDEVSFVTRQGPIEIRQSVTDYAWPFVNTNRLRLVIRGSGGGGGGGGATRDNNNAIAIGGSGGHSSPGAQSANDGQDGDSAGTGQVAAGGIGVGGAGDGGHGGRQLFDSDPSQSDGATGWVGNIGGGGGAGGASNQAGGDGGDGQDRASVNTGGGGGGGGGGGETATIYAGQTMTVAGGSGGGGGGGRGADNPGAGENGGTIRIGGAPGGLGGDPHGGLGGSGEGPRTQTWTITRDGSQTFAFTIGAGGGGGGGGGAALQNSRAGQPGQDGDPGLITLEPDYS